MKIPKALCSMTLIILVGLTGIISAQPNWFKPPSNAVFIGNFSDKECRQVKPYYCRGSDIQLFKVSETIWGQYYYFDGPKKTELVFLEEVQYSPDSGKLAFRAYRNNSDSPPIHIFYFKGKLTENGLSGELKILDPLNNNQPVINNVTLKKMEEVGE